MSINASTERRLLTADEHEVVQRSHYPHISELDRDELVDVARRLRAFRDKARDIAHRQRREIRGKAEPRGAAPVRDNTGTEMKRRIFASALKRVKREASRLAAAERKPQQAEIAQQALELKRSMRRTHHPSAGRTARGGMQSKPSNRRTVEADPREIGRVSQFVRDAQARRDG